MGTHPGGSLSGARGYTNRPTLSRDCSALLRSPVRPAHKIGIGGSLAAPPLPHHRAYGSVHGGSVGYAVTEGFKDGRPNEAR